MNYQEAIDFLFSSLPMYQRVGKSAFKKDLGNTLALCEALDNPQHKFKSIHVAGTNGKGSSSHMLASVLQEAGYKTGLYTSPHLKSFTERIRIDGTPISEQGVVDFVTDNQAAISEIKPSFFEMTVAMAFDYFAKEQVDIAIIEVGLGGRLDSTNVIIPEVSLITNIGLDHTDMLGDSLEQIAFEKGGIIKEGITTVIGKKQAETSPVFEKLAAERSAHLVYAEDQTLDLDQYPLDLKGKYQKDNLGGVLTLLQYLAESGWKIGEEAVKNGLQNVVPNTGLKGRWQQLNLTPLTICDTGHNLDGIKVIIEQMKTLTYDHLFLVLGFVNDKNVQDLLKLLPDDAQYIFCQARVPRAMPLDDVRKFAAEAGIEATYIPDVNDALDHARKQAGEKDFIFVGGSTFVVAELNEL